MRKILTGYVVNFNRRHRRYGHLFQNRYKSIVCQEDRYLKELVRYIHLNLLRAGLVENIIELDQSLWSGHSALMGKVKREWQNSEYVLSFFGQNIAALAQQVCKKYNISLGELHSGGRRRDVAMARGSISWIAVRELGFSGADVARYLGVTNSCVTRFIASGKKPDVDNLIKNL